MPLDASLEKTHLTIKVPDATSPNALQGAGDKRVLGVSLHSIELKTQEADLIDSYPINVSDTKSSAALNDVLGPGWSDLDKTYVWSGGKALLQLPVPEECRPGVCSAILTIKSPGASEKRPVKIFIKTDSKETPLLPLSISTPLPQEILVPLSDSRAITNITIIAPEATPQRAWYEIYKKRNPGVALHSIDLLVHSINPKYTYPMIVSNIKPSVALTDALGTGWHDLNTNHVWSGAKALLKLPVLDVCKSKACSVKITLNAFGASKSRPVEVFFKTDTEDIPLVPPLVFRRPVIKEVVIPLNTSLEIYNLTIEIPEAISPNALRGTDDTRVLGVALRSIKLKTPKVE